MRPVLRALLAAVPLTAALTGLAAPAAQAQPAKPATATWTVTPGGSSTPSEMRPSFILADAATGATLYGCGYFALSLYLKHGSGLPGNIGRVIAMSTTSPCKGDGLTLSLAGGSTTAAPWTVKAESESGDSKVFGSIHITDLAATGTGCTFDVSGYLDWYLTGMNFQTQRETTTASNVTGCNGKINNGDSLTLKVLGYQLSSTISIDSP